MLKIYDNIENIEVGVDEVARGPLIGDVFSAAVIWSHEECDIIKDSKKLSRSRREYVNDYIKDNALDYSISRVSNKVIDEINIYNATQMAMHKALDGINIDFDTILVDGNSFKPYRKGKLVKPFKTVVGGDNEYISIAAASILAKVAHDTYIMDLCDEYPELEKYDLRSNMGYGTSKHIEAIRIYGYSDFHRKSFKIKGLL